MPRQGNKGKSSSGSKSVKLGPGFPPQLLNRLLRSQRRCIPFRNTFLTMYNTSQCSRGIPNKSDSEQKQDNFYYSSPKAATDMGVSSSESHDLTAFYEMLSASFGVLSQNTGFYPSLDRIIETTLGPLNLGPGGGSYNEPISCLHHQGQKSKSSPPKSGHSKVVCSNCKKEGHSIEKCWSVGGGAKGQGPKKKWSKSSMKSKHGQGQANVSKDNSSSSVSHSILILRSKEDVLLSHNTPSHSNSIYFIIDSRASAHMCPDQSYFLSYKKLDTPKCIWVANDQTINAIGIGDIEVKLFLDGQLHPRTLKDVLHLP